MRPIAAATLGTAGLGFLLAGRPVTPWAFALGGGLVTGLVLVRGVGRGHPGGRTVAALLATAVVALTPLDGGVYLIPAALTSLVLEMRPIESSGPDATAGTPADDQSPGSRVTLERDG